MKHILILAPLLFIGCNTLPIEDKQYTVAAEEEPNTTPVEENTAIVAQVPKTVKVKKKKRKVLKVTASDALPQFNEQSKNTVNPNRFTPSVSFEGVYKNKRYKYIRDAASWHDAYNEAKYLGGTLACLDTDDKLDYIHLLMAMHGNPQTAWIGLTDQDKEGQWKWICGQNYNPTRTYKLERGLNLDARDYAHIMPNKGLMSRVDSGTMPNFPRANNPKGPNKVTGYIVEFTDTTLDTQTNPIEAQYQLTQPTLYAELLPIREKISNWRGEKDTLQQAKQQLETIIEKNETFAPAYKELARAYIKGGMVNSSYYLRNELAVAEVHLHKAIQLEPNYAQAYIMLAEMLTRAKRYGEAPVALFNAAKRQADEISLHLQWGLLRQKKREREDALKHYQQAKQLANKSSREYRSAVSAMASIYSAKGKYPEAIAEHKELLELRPDDAWTWGNYASFLFYRMQDTDGAIEANRKALALKDYGMARSNLAYALYAKWAMLKDAPNTAAQAQTYFGEAYTLYPNIKYVISRLMAYKHTQSVAFALQKWQIENHNMEPKESNQST